MSWFHSPLEVTYAAAISACEKGEGPLRDVIFRNVRGDQFQPYPEIEAVQMIQDTDQDTKIAVGSSYKFLKCRWNDFCSFIDRRTKVPASMCAPAGRWAEALGILERMPPEHRDLVSFSDA